MTAFVLDASIAIAWLLDDEDIPQANEALAYLETREALVPQIWHLEMRSALLGAERRRRISVDSVDELLRKLVELPVSTDAELNLVVALALARRYRLAIYEAVYLELALRADAPLATLDQALENAAVAEGYSLIGRHHVSQ